MEDIDYAQDPEYRKSIRDARIGGTSGFIGACLTLDSAHTIHDYYSQKYNEEKDIITFEKYNVPANFSPKSEYGLIGVESAMTLIGTFMLVYSNITAKKIRKGLKKGIEKKVK